MRIPRNFLSMLQKSTHSTNSFRSSSLPKNPFRVSKVSSTESSSLLGSFESRWRDDEEWKTLGAESAFAGDETAEVGLLAGLLEGLLEGLLVVPPAGNLEVVPLRAFVLSLEEATAEVLECVVGF